MLFEKILLSLVLSSTILFSYAQEVVSQPKLVDLMSLSKVLGLEIKAEDKNIPLYAEAAKWLGVRYRRAGMTTAGVDCSGLTSIIYRNVFDKKILRRSADIATSVKKTLQKHELQPGDLVFFSTSRKKSSINHVGVFLGGKLFVHSSCGKGVIVSSLDEAYYKRTWRKGGRFEDLEQN